MKERPILFSGPMVRAILSRTKRQTRRICKPAQFHCMSQVVEIPDPLERGQVYNGSHFGDEEGDVQFASPYGGRGDRLWVRETFAHLYRDNIEPASRHPEDVAYKADGLTPDPYVYGNWKPSIHMPRWASRITLEVTGVRVERLQDISRDDAIAEGVRPLVGSDGPNHWTVATDFGSLNAPTPQACYELLWNWINGPESWSANPWVWVVEWPALLNK